MEVEGKEQMMVRKETDRQREEGKEEKERKKREKERGFLFPHFFGRR